MELALLVWLVDVIGSIKEVIGFSIFLLCIGTMVFGLITALMVDNAYGKEEKEHGTAVGTVDCGRCSGLLEKGYE